MDAFDGESDLSEVEAPPTPGPVATPRVASPEPTEQAESAADDPWPPRTTLRRASRRISGAETVAFEAPAAIKQAPGSTSTKAESSATTSTPARRASTRDRKPSAKLRSQSPAADTKSSPQAATTTAAAAAASSSNTAETPRSKVKVNLSRKSKPSADGATIGDSGSSRGATPQPGSATKVTLKIGTRRNKKADDVRDLVDEDVADREGNKSEPAHKDDVKSKDDFVPDRGVGDDTKSASATGKRDRSTRDKAQGRRRAVIADDEAGDMDETGEVSMAPQKKRAKLTQSGYKGETKSKAQQYGRSSKSGKNTVDYSEDSDEDEEMVDAASDEEELLDAAGLDSDDSFDEEDAGPTRGSKAARKSTSSAADGRKKVGGRASAVSNARTNKVGRAALGSTASSSSASGGSKGMSAEARMRASIDAAVNKSIKPMTGAASASSTKLNPQASAFRPGSVSTLKSGAACTGAGRSVATSSGAKRTASTGGKPAFGKSMSGWDQLFGGISGLSSSSTSTPTKSTLAKPGVGASGSKSSTSASASASATGIRPDPRLESASPAEVQQIREAARQEHLNTDECFDLLAHADIMLAFERSIYLQDRKLSARLRPHNFNAGSILVSQKHKQQQKQAGGSMMVAK